MVARAKSRHLVVRIDVSVFISNAARAGLLLTPGEAADVLQDWGFAPYQRDLWHCDRQALATLADSEITEIVGEVPETPRTFE